MSYQQKNPPGEDSKGNKLIFQPDEAPPVQQHMSLRYYLYNVVDTT